MGQSQFLIDTNAVIDYLGNKLPASGMDFMNGVIDAVNQVLISRNISDFKNINGLQVIDPHIYIMK